MHKYGINYKNLYKYDFINLYETVSGSSKPKYISYRNNNTDYFNNESQKLNKTPKKFNRNSKYFHTFHKSLLHLKLSINPKFKNNENICYTERSPKQKRQIENFKNTYEKIFLTNTDDRRKNKNNFPQLNTDYKTKFDQNLINSGYMSIPSDTFLPFKKNKFMYFLPDIINEKLSDFKDELAMIRKVKLINAIKVDRQKRKNALLEIQFEQNEIGMHSLKTSLNLINIYKRCFGDYNKFLINEIKKEKILLNDFNLFKKNLEDQVNILKKQFDDIIKELEIVNNFKLIFTAIKNKKRLENTDKSSKIFIEELKKKLKSQILIKKKKISISTITTINKSHSKKEKKRISLKNPSAVNKYKKHNSIERNSTEKIKEHNKRYRKSKSIITVPKIFKKKMERFNSYQPFSIAKKRKIEKSLNNSDNLDYDVERNEKIIVKRILKFVNAYNDVNSKIVDLRLEGEREENSEQSKNNKILDNQSKDLLYLKNYNKTLNIKFKILCYHKNDYSLLLAIYRKINKIICSVISVKIKNFNHIIEKLKNSYDKNKLYYAYKTKITDPNYRKSYFEKELINYIYNALSIIEFLQCELINKKNEYLNNNYYQEQILEYENKMDTARKLINNREKRNKDLLRKQQIYEKVIKKSNKIIFKPFRKTPINYQFKFKGNKNIKDNNNEDEELLLYL